LAQELETSQPRTHLASQCRVPCTMQTPPLGGSPAGLDQHRSVAAALAALRPLPLLQPPSPRQAAARTPLAVVGIDTTNDGQANLIFAGADRNRDGIPDALQGPLLFPSPRLAAAPSPVAAAGVDSFGSGRANMIYAGVDRNRVVSQIPASMAMRRDPTPVPLRSPNTSPRAAVTGTRGRGMNDEVAGVQSGILAIASPISLTPRSVGAVSPRSASASMGSLPTPAAVAPGSIIQHALAATSLSEERSVALPIGPFAIEPLALTPRSASLGIVRRLPAPLTELSPGSGSVGPTRAPVLFDLATPRLQEIGGPDVNTREPRAEPSEGSEERERLKSMLREVQGDMLKLMMEELQARLQQECFSWFTQAQENLTQRARVLNTDVQRLAQAVESTSNTCESHFERLGTDLNSQREQLASFARARQSVDDAREQESSERTMVLAKVGACSQATEAASLEQQDLRSRFLELHSQQQDHATTLTGSLAALEDLVHKAVVAIGSGLQPDVNTGEGNGLQGASTCCSWEFKVSVRRDVEGLQKQLRESMVIQRTNAEEVRRSM